MNVAISASKRRLTVWLLFLLHVSIQLGDEQDELPQWLQFRRRLMRDELATSDLGIAEVRHGDINGRGTDRYQHVCVLRRLDTISTHDDEIRDRKRSAADG